MLKKEMKELLVVLSVLASIAVVNGADFKPDRTLYVSTKGSDANNGFSEKTALKTIGKAAEIVKPGDLVVVKGGKYQEHVTLEKSGTEEKPIIFRALPNETVLVTWGWDIGGWKKIEGTHFCYESSFPYAINMLWERKTLSRYLELENREVLDKQPGGFVFDKKTGKIYIHAFDGGNPEFAGITAVPYSDLKNPVPYNSNISKTYRWNKGISINGSYNTVEGFELAFHPVGGGIAKVLEDVKGTCLRGNIIYGCTCGILLNRKVLNSILENNYVYKSTGSGIWLGSNIQDITVKNNWLFNNGYCPPFLGQENASGGQPYNLARYGSKKGAVNVAFIENMIISDDSSRTFGVMRCKAGIDGNMDMNRNVFVGGGGPTSRAEPDSKASVKNNTVIGGEINYEHLAKDGREYKPELKANLCLKDNKENPCFADPSFYDYRLRNDSPFIGNGAYPEAGQILYVSTSSKEAGDGSTPEKAFESLSDAFKKALPGNCIYILPGTYKENIALAKKENITLRNYGKGKVVFANSAFDLKKCKNLNIDGLIFKDSKIQFQNSNSIEFLHCVFDGNGIKAENCGFVKIINDTFANNAVADTGNAMLILRNNLFMDCKSLPVKSEAIKTISENNAFSGESADKILTEWKGKYNESFPSFANSVKLDNNYVLPDNTKLAFFGLGWTFIGACGNEKKNKPVMVENLKAANVLSDRAVLQWETPFDYPDVNIVCKDKKGGNICSTVIKQGQYKQTSGSECIKGLNPNSQYELTLTFTNPGGIGKVEKKLTVTTPEKQVSQPKTIYVSKSGDDTKSGLSSNEAKKSISAALNAALNGDIVLVAPGTYMEEISIDIDGISKDKPFVLKSEKPGMAVISANYIFNTAVGINQGKYITIDGFKFSGLRYSSSITALIISKSEGVTVRNCIFDRNWQKKESGGCSNVQLKCEDVKDIEVSNCIFDTGFHGIWMVNSNDVRIFNNTFWHTGINGIHVGCTKDYNVDIFNNIMEDVVGGHNNPAVSIGEHGKKIICDYNFYWKTEKICPAQRLYGIGGKEYGAPWSVMLKDSSATLEDARKMYGVEKHGQFADPLLKDPQNGDFSVKPGSPALGKGRNGSNIGVDMSVFSK